MNEKTNVKKIKCHVFKFSICTADCTPNSFYDFDAKFRDIICPIFIETIGVDAMNDMQLVPRSLDFNLDGWMSFYIHIPVDIYGSKFDEAIDKIDILLSDTFSGSNSEQEKDEELAYVA